MTARHFYIRVDHPVRSGSPGVISKLIRRFLPTANPYFESRYDEVVYWYLEVEKSVPVREVGFDAKGQPVVIGPHGANRGVWPDSPVTLDPAGYTQVSHQEFESAWKCVSAGGLIEN